MAQRCPRNHPKPERVHARRPGESATGVMRLDLVDHDPRVAEFGAAQHGLQSGDERLVTAPVDAQGLLLAGGRGRAEVGDDVTPAEGIDRLLRIADQYECRYPAESPLENLPLHRVGVLELIDHHDGPPPAHSESRRRVVTLEGAGQSAQQVVVADDAAAALADFQFGQNGFGEIDPCGGPGVGIGVARSQLGRRILHHLAGEFEGVPVVQQRRLAQPAEAGEVEIVDDLCDEFVKAFRQCHAVVGITGHPQRCQHQAAELVDGGNRRRIETGECIGEPGATLREFIGRARQQVAHHLVLARQIGVVESGQCVGDLTAHPVPQFPAGRAGEGDQQHLVQGGRALGNIAGHQTGQRERLAGSGTGLQHQRRAWLR